MYLKNLLISLSILNVYSYAFASETTAIDDQWDGKKYLNNSELQYQWATSYVKKLKLSGTEKILDIGCGDGRVTAVIAHASPNGSVLGIDTSDSMLEAAKDLKSKIHLYNLDFTKRDATNLGFENEFDFIVSFSCLHWIFDHHAVIQEIEKSLKPSGRVFLYFVPDHGRNRIDHAINSVVSSFKWKHYFLNFSTPYFFVTPSIFLNYVEEAGLLLKRLESIIVDESFQDKQAFAAWMSGWMSHLKILPKELHQDFLEDIVDCYIAKHPIDKEGKLHYIGYWVEVELQKPS